MKLPWDSVFRKCGKEWCIVGTIRCGGVTVRSNDEICFTKESSFILGGVNWSLFIGKDLEVRTDKEVAVIEGVYY